MAEFSPLELDCLPLVRERLAENPPEISEHTFTNLYIWRKSRQIELIDSGGAILFLARREGYTSIFGPPVGGIEPAQAAAMASGAAGGAPVPFERLTRSYAEASLGAGAEILEDRANFDYVYRRSDLAELEGRRYHAKRNLIAQCLASCSPTYEDIAPSNIREASEMMDEWCRRRGCNHDTGLCDEYIAVKELFANYAKLGAIGAAIRIEGKIAAFTVGEKLNDSTAVIHFEKAMPEYKGLYQVMNNWFAKNHLGKFEFVNREQDLGMDGLRRAKESYFPSHMVEKYSMPLPATTKLNRCTE